MSDKYYEKFREWAAKRRWLIFKTNDRGTVIYSVAPNGKVSESLLTEPVTASFACYYKTFKTWALVQNWFDLTEGTKDYVANNKTCQKIVIGNSEFNLEDLLRISTFWLTPEGNTINVLRKAGKVDWIAQGEWRQ